MLGDAVRYSQEEPVVIDQAHRPAHVAEDMPGGHDVQHRQPLDGLRVIQRQPLRDPGAAIVADQAEPAEAELAHQPDLILRHEPFRVRTASGVRPRLGRVSVAAQVSRHDGVVPGQAGGDLPPYQVVLRVAVQ